jgi:hypothetical protein
MLNIDFHSHFTIENRTEKWSTYCFVALAEPCYLPSKCREERDFQGSSGMRRSIAQISTTSPRVAQRAEFLAGPVAAIVGFHAAAADDQDNLACEQVPPDRIFITLPVAPDGVLQANYAGGFGALCI